MEIVFENEHFLAINKPSGLLSIPDRSQSSPSLRDMLQQQYGEIFTVHRLDRDTSGLIIFAKDADTHKSLSEKFMTRDMQKYYLGLVNGCLHPEVGTIDAAIAEHPAKNGKMIVHQKGKPSVTEYETIEKFSSFSFVRYKILTGRTHQIRVHTQYLGSSIVGDAVYGDGKPVYISALKRNYKLSKNELEERPILNRLALHSSELKFNLDNNEYTLQAPLPKDLRALLQQLRKN